MGKKDEINTVYFNIGVTMNKATKLNKRIVPLMEKKFRKAVKDQMKGIGRVRLHCNAIQYR